jgi:hypothetical protein
LIAQLYQYAAQFKLFPGNEENTEWKLSGNS